MTVSPVARAARSRPDGGLRGMRARAASLGLLVILVALPGFALWGATFTYGLGQAVKHATEISNAFEQARYAVAAEESLERKYRVEPSAQVRALHRAAGADLLAALERADRLVAAADHAPIADIKVRHARYAEAILHMFKAVDDHDPAAAAVIDATESDPSFDDMQSRVFALADRYRGEASGHLQDLIGIQTEVLIATPVVFALGAMAVLFFWSALRSYRRREEAGLVREAEAVRSSERRFRGLVQNTSDLILIGADAGEVTYQSPAAESVWGHGAAELLGQPVLGLVHADDQPALHALWQQLRQTPPDGAQGVTRSIELRLRDGAGRWREAEMLATNLLHDEAVRGIVVTVRDITERKAFEQQLTQQAFYDALTGLPNRVLFRERLGRALVRARRRHDRVGLLFIDLDKFKLVNDSLGHRVGDTLLAEAAVRLGLCVRPQDTVARLGGDEFVVLLETMAGEQDVISVAKAVTHQFSLPFLLDGREVVVTASIGIAVGSTGQEHADSLLRDADVAMYRAKSAGRACHVVFDPSMNADSLARLELENDLRHALDHGELRVFYQPIIRFETGEFTEVEALVRWQHPTMGLVSPATFIPMAEETGLIVPLGLWVLEEACRQVVAWSAMLRGGRPLTLSVNLSPRQFQQPSLVADVARVLRESGLAADSLKLEITEGVIMSHAESAIRTLWELKALGIKLAIDDFGTGYSSLSYLKRLPLDVLKIDRSFVSGLSQSQEDTAIVHAIMAMSKSLNLTVTAEGVETVQQADVLNGLGCDNGQGYLFSRPLDADKAGELLEAATRMAAQAPALAAG